MPGESIVVKITADDGYSEVMKKLSAVTKAFDKDVDELEDALVSLSKQKAPLKAALKAAQKELTATTEQFNASGDAVSRMTMEMAQVKVDTIRRNLALVNKTARETEKQFNNLGKSSQKSGERMKLDATGVVRAISASGLKDVLADFGKSISTAWVGSAFGSDAGNLFSGAFSGIGSGASAGAMIGSTLLPGLGTAVGTAAGAVIGGLVGAASGGLQNEQAKDDSFKSYVQEGVEGQLSEMDSIRSSGSAIAGQREQDQIAFARRFGSEEAARDYLSQVKTMAVKTNYEYDEITGYSKSLLNTYSADETLEVLKDLSDATAGLNLDSNGVNMFINGLSRMRTTGKVTQEYLNYYSERGLHVYDALARGAGVNESDVAGMVSKGQISGADAAKYILAYIREEFGGLSESLAGTYDAMVDNLGDAEANLNAVMGEAYNNARKDGIQKQTDWLESGQMEEAYKAIGAWQAELETTKERLEREALEAVMTGALSEDYQNSAQGGRLKELAGEYQTLLAGQEADSQEAGAKMGALLAEAKIIAANEYNASQGAQLALESEKALIQSVREDSGLNIDYWSAGYVLGQEFSKGRAAGLGGIGDFEVSPERLEHLYDTKTHKYTGPRSPKAFGMDRVPYDDYPALLHEGERVLTAREAREQDRGSGNISITVTGNTFGAGLDEAAVAQALADQIALQLAAGGGR